MRTQTAEKRTTTPPPKAKSPPKRSGLPVDVHVGSRIRMRRMFLGMSQEKLGDALDLTFQQVQKYEKGSNRVGSSRLHQIAQVLGVKPAYFFDGAPENGSGGSSHQTEVTSFLATTEGVKIARAWPKIKNPRIQKALVDLIELEAEKTK